MSFTDDDAFVAWGGGNYDYLAIGPANFGFVTITKGNDPNFNVGASAGGHRLGVVGYAGPLADDGATIGPQQNDYSNNAGVLGSSLQFTGVAGLSDGLQPGLVRKLQPGCWYHGSPNFPGAALRAARPSVLNARDFGSNPVGLARLAECPSD
jgi:hypothetical protein